MAWFRNQYRHRDCPEEPGIEWDGEWSCMCNSECPACGTKDIEPYDAETLEDDEPDPVATYEVTTFAYCGMTIPHGVYDEYDEALARVTRRIEMLKEKGCDVHQISPHSWEVGEPENCNMVPDFCGTLSIQEVFK